MIIGKYSSTLLTTLCWVLCNHAFADNVTHIQNLEGSQLPYTVLRNDIKDNAKPDRMLEVRNGGFGSDMTAHPSDKNQFYALTDRGPNAKYNGRQGKGKMFPVPDYTPRIGLFEVKEDGSIIMVRTILLKRPDGTPISGLPNTSDLGGTGETPYDKNGQVITIQSDKPFNNKLNPIKLDNFGLDGEGLVALKDGTFWISDEYGPHLVHFDANGIEIGRINAFNHDQRTMFNLPAEYVHRRPNRGMEGLAITPDEKVLIGTMQSTMFNPDKAVKKLNLVRLVTVNLENGKVGQYIYKQDKNQNSNSGIVALSNHEFAVIERDGSFYHKNQNAIKRIYRIDLSNATDLESISNSGRLVQDEKLGLLIDGKTIEQAVFDNGWGVLEEHNVKPVSKKLVVDLVKLLNYPHDKLEGMWLISPTKLGVINDDDFATWSTKGKLEQKYLDEDKTLIDSSRLYIIDGVDLN